MVAKAGIACYSSLPRHHPTVHDRLTSLTPSTQALILCHRQFSSPGLMQYNVKGDLRDDNRSLT